MLDFVLPILKSRVLKLIYFIQGQDPSKRRRRRTLKPEAVPTIFQHVPQPKASTQSKLSNKRTVKSKCEAVSKQRINGLSCQDANSMSKLIGKYVTKIVYIYDHAFTVGVVGKLVSTLDLEF